MHKGNQALGGAWEKWVQTALSHSGNCQGKGWGKSLHVMVFAVGSQYPHCNEDDDWIGFPRLPHQLCLSRHESPNAKGDPIPLLPSFPLLYPNEFFSFQAFPGKSSCNLKCHLPFWLQTK